MHFRSSRNRQRRFRDHSLPLRGRPLSALSTLSDSAKPNQRPLILFDYLAVPEYFGLVFHRVLLGQRALDSAGVAGGEAHRRDVARDYAARADYAAVADSHARADYDVRAEPAVAAEDAASGKLFR